MLTNIPNSVTNNPAANVLVILLIITYPSLIASFKQSSSSSLVALERSLSDSSETRFSLGIIKKVLANFADTPVVVIARNADSQNFENVSEITVLIIIDKGQQMVNNICIVTEVRIYKLLLNPGDFGGISPIYFHKDK